MFSQKDLSCIFDSDTNTSLFFMTFTAQNFHCFPSKISSVNVTNPQDQITVPR